MTLRGMLLAGMVVWFVGIGAMEAAADPPEPGDLDVTNLWLNRSSNPDEVLLGATITNVTDMPIEDDFYCAFIYWDADEWVCVFDGVGILVTEDIPPGGLVSVDAIDSDYGGYCQVGLIVPYEPGSDCNVFDPLGRGGQNQYTENLCVGEIDVGPGTPWQFSPPVQLAGRSIAVNMTNFGPNQFSIPFQIGWDKHVGGVWSEFGTQTVTHPFMWGQLDHSESYTLPTDYELDQVRVRLDTEDILVEHDEDNNETDPYQIPLSDLTVTDIWWDPPTIYPGANVRFYARVENVGPGGTVQDYDVKFIVESDTGVEFEDLVTVQHDTGFGMRAPAFDNADFSQGTFDNWAIESGSIGAPAAVMSPGLEVPLYHMVELNRSDSMISEPFLIEPGDDVIVVRCTEYYYPSYNDASIELVDATTMDILRVQATDVDEEEVWATYMLDVRDLRGQTVRLRARVDGSVYSSYRMRLMGAWRGSDPGAGMTVAAPMSESTWYVEQSGFFTITAIVDPPDEYGVDQVPEVDDFGGAPNNERVECPTCPPSPFVSFDQPAVELGEGDATGMMAFNISLSEVVDFAQVSYHTWNGTAEAGLDYEETSGVLEFVNTDVGVIEVPILDDEIYEGDETFWLVLSGPVGCDFGTEPNYAIATIIDNDPPPPLPGDLDCDGRVTFDDIAPFVKALAGQDEYEATYPDCRWLNADVDGNGLVTFDDIWPFISLLGE